MLLIILADSKCVKYSYTFGREIFVAVDKSVIFGIKGTLTASI